MKNEPTTISHNRLKQARQCLAMIRDIAARGASSSDPENVGYALQELTQVLFERTGTEDITFEPISAEYIEDLPQLYAELDFVNACTQEMRNREWFSIPRGAPIQ